MWHSSAVTLRAHRLAAAAAFFLQGLLFISLTTRLPKIQTRYGLDELALSGVLLMVVLLAGAGSVLAEAIARRADSAAALRLGLLLVVLGLGVVALSPALPLFLGGLAIYGVGLGAVDASTNMQAVTLEHHYGRPILPSFHGAWTAGGLVGTVLAIALASVSLTAGLLPLCLLPLLALAVPLLRHAKDPVADAAATETVKVPWRRISVLGLAIVLFYMVDTAATTWGPVYLSSTFDSPDRLVPLATLPYLAASLGARLAGDHVVHRLGPVPVVRAGGVLAAVALAVIVFAPTWWVAVLGFTALGATVAVIAPLSFSAAAAVAGESADPAARQARVDQVIARFNQFNYVGALLGSVLTGVVGSGSLRVGFAVPMVLILAIVPMARVFRPVAAHVR